MEDWIAQLNKEWEELESQNCLGEETVKDYIIKPFLEHIGYTKETCRYRYEENTKEGRVDIYIELKDKIGEGVHIETKRGDLNIGKDEIEQIVKYLLMTPIKWGILTNGKEYYLINKDIVSDKNNENGAALLDKVVMVCDLKDRQSNIKYFSKAYLFENRKTLLMRDIAQFKAYKSYKNWEVYFSTLYGFFNYYCEVLEPDLILPSTHSYLHLSDIREKHFKQYLLTLKPKVKSKEKLSISIVKSKCSHISEMYKEFEKRNLITTNNFRNIRANILMQFIDEGIVTEKNEVDNYLTNENVDIIIKKLNQTQKKEVNIRLIIFSLITYHGFTKAQVVEFLLQPWSCVDFEKNTILYQGIKRTMPMLLANNFRKLKKLTGKKKSILGSKGERGQSISIDIVSATFDEVKKMKEITGRKYFTPEYTRKMLIKKLFDSGFSVEEISGYIGISLNSIETILGKELISKIGLRRWNTKTKVKAKHPFEEEFNQIL